MCLAKSHGMGQQQQQRAKLTGVVYANAAAQLMKMIYVSSAHQANNTADIDSASSLYHDHVSLHFHHAAPAAAGPRRGRASSGADSVTDSAHSRVAAAPALTVSSIRARPAGRTVA